MCFVGPAASATTRSSSSLDAEMVQLLLKSVGVQVAVSELREIIALLPEVKKAAALVAELSNMIHQVNSCCVSISHLQAVLLARDYMDSFCLIESAVFLGHSIITLCLSIAQRHRALHYVPSDRCVVAC